MNSSEISFIIGSLTSFPYSFLDINIYDAQIVDINIVCEREKDTKAPKTARRRLPVRQRTVGQKTYPFNPCCFMMGGGRFFLSLKRHHKDNTRHAQDTQDLLPALTGALLGPPGSLADHERDPLPVDLETSQIHQYKSEQQNGHDDSNDDADGNRRLSERRHRCKVTRTWLQRSKSAHGTKTMA